MGVILHQARNGVGPLCGRELPDVSVVIPCRNERLYIEECVRSILRQEAPPGGIELIVADGMSEDGSREILRRVSQEDDRLKVVDNQRRNTPSGMNAGIRAARGRYIAILGAHAKYAPDYIRICCEVLDREPEIWCAGGPVISRAKSRFGRAVAIAMSHPVGVGNARHRFPDYEGIAEGACFPVFRREVFSRIGLYDEALIRNQDDELNLRLTKSGGKVLLTPRAGCEYYVRESAAKLFRQYFEYGFWRVAVLRKHRIPASWRQVVPALFFVLMLAAGAGSQLLPARWSLPAALVLPLLYGAALAAAGAQITIRQKSLLGLLAPLAAAIMHAAYAAGFVWGVLSGRNSERNSAAPLTHGSAAAPNIPAD